MSVRLLMLLVAAIAGAGWVAADPVPLLPFQTVSTSLDASAEATQSALLNLTLPNTAAGAVVTINVQFTYTTGGSSGFNATLDNQVALGAFVTLNDTTGSAVISFRPETGFSVLLNISISVGTADATIAASLVCASSSYAQVGSFSCAACPANSVIATVAAVSSSACVCDYGYYSSTGRPPCIECTEGATCNSVGTIQPVPIHGYYFLNGSYPGIAECPIKDACTGGLSSSANCAPGYSGRFCGECDDNYYKLGHTCDTCYVERAALAIGCIIFLFAFPVALYLFAFMFLELNTFPVVIDYLQIVALFGTFTVAWPEKLVDFFNSISFILFNWQLAEPECGVDGFSWFWTFGFTLAMPIVMLFDILFFILVFSFLRTCLSVCGCCGKQAKEAVNNSTVDDITDAADGSTITSPAKALCHFSTMTVTRFANFSISAYLTFLEIVYLPVTYMAFSLYACTSTAGVTYLNASPDITCWEGSHSSAQPVAILALLVYTLGIPLVQMIVQWVKLKRGELYGDFHTMIRMGPLYRRYAENRWWWPAIAYFRRAVITLPAIFLIHYPTYQVIATLVILNGYLVAELIIRPYSRQLGNLNNILLIVVQYLLLFFGLAYTKSELATDAEYIIGIVLALGGLVLGLLLTALEITWMFTPSVLGLKNNEPKMYFVSLPPKRDMKFLTRKMGSTTPALVVIDYISPQNGHLTVAKGDRVVVVDRDDGADMWTVEFNNRRGLVPSANLEIVSQ
ncbi:hypothetical protein CAOG_006563 [Capsaspora owczarzaki ATCC 30864]|uniref:SH3 domain-containing protein n=2 Tax=Capsaspora owczarzaki (strain ATCC 30864) TaxID=595528 RepID=A0A0D2VX69_CAPO3|nr:hypothetical protein CAOG_006563 [Capsaspora owczarzaki ATCC 30864]